MMNKIFLVLMILTAGPGLNAQVRLKLEPGVEYLSPTHGYRSIQTVSGNMLVGLEWFKRSPLSLYGGVTATYAWGTIIQWDDHFNDVAFHNKAFGLGPVFLLRYEPFVYKGFSISPDFGGGLIFYSAKFPYGGDIYNFMWRMGGSIHYRPNAQYAFNLSLKWMHVSNGQGLGPQNPSYEAAGIGFGFVKYIGIKNRKGV